MSLNVAHEYPAITARPRATKIKSKKPKHRIMHRPKQRWLAIVGRVHGFRSNFSRRDAALSLGLLYLFKHLVKAGVSESQSHAKSTACAKQAKNGLDGT